MRDMERRFAAPVHGAVPRVEGYTVNEFVAYEPKIGHEMIVGYRFARDFGPVVSFGPGGIFAEYLASSFKEGSANLFLSPATADRELVAKLLSRNVVRTLVAGGLRNTKPAISDGALVDVVMAFLGRLRGPRRGGGYRSSRSTPSRSRPRSGRESRGSWPSTFSSSSRPSPRASSPCPPPAASLTPSRRRGPWTRSTGSSGRGARPWRGVSEKSVNNGRIILRNLIENGFDRSRLYVVKPGSAEIEGCRCFPDFASLPRARRPRRPVHPGGGLRRGPSPR